MDKWGGGGGGGTIPGRGGGLLIVVQMAPRRTIYMYSGTDGPGGQIILLQMLQGDRIIGEAGGGGGTCILAYLQGMTVSVLVSALGRLIDILMYMHQF